MVAPEVEQPDEKSELANIRAMLPTETAKGLSRQMLSSCPVLHSDADGGFWMINRHADIMSVMQDQEAFVNGNKGVRVPDEPVERPYLPPIDSNPPMHRSVRNLESPYLSPKALSALEPGIRRIIRVLVADLAPLGRCDIAKDLAQVFPPKITFTLLFGLEDEDELERLRHWVRMLSYGRYEEDPADLRNAQAEWNEWNHAFVTRRRSTARRDDIIDGLLYGQVAGDRPLTDAEVAGAIEILTFGGFDTTADATSNFVVRMIDEPGLESWLRENPEHIPAAVEEAMRLEPPVTTRPRRAAHDVVINGQTIKAGDRLLCNYLAANIDPDEWEAPDRFNLSRRRNRVMTFGVGPHRCIGSTLARLSLRIVVEELLAQLQDLRFETPERERRLSISAGRWRAVDSLPVQYRPLVRGEGHE
jgi:cytochrome P450